MKRSILRSIAVVLGGMAIGAAFRTPVLLAGSRPDPALTTREELGRLLFWDPILSGERNVACASCHHPDLAYADGRDLPLGAGGVGLGTGRRDVSGGTIPPVRRNSPTVLNTKFNGLDDGRGGRRNRGGGGLESVNQVSAPMFWDSRVRSLETQALEPIKAFDEMRGNAYPAEVAVDSVVARLRAIPEYVDLFAAVYGPGRPIDAQLLGESIAAFERTLVAMNSPFDRFRAGEVDAMTAQQKEGMETFEDAGCDRCHEGLMFSDYDLHTLGVAENPTLSEPDTGAGRFRFRTPSLRNVALTAPYMHGGTLATLQDVVRFYDDGLSRNPAVATNGNRGNGGGNGGRVATVDGDFRRVDDLSDLEINDIVAFLEALTDPDFDRTIPSRVPSNLPPGGAIGQ